MHPPPPPPHASTSKRRLDLARRNHGDDQRSPIASTLDSEDDDVSWGSWDDQEGLDSVGEDCNDGNDGRGLRGAAAGMIQVKAGVNEEKENEHVETQSLGGQTIDPCKLDAAQDGRGPRMTALKDITNRNARGSMPKRRPKEKSGGRIITPNDPISRLSDGVGVRRVNGEAVLINYERLLQEEMTRRLVLQRKVGDLAAEAGKLAEARDEIARLRGLVDRPSTERARGWMDRRSKSRTVCVTFKAITLGGIFWLAIVNMSVHSAVARLLYQQRQSEGERRMQTYLREGVASESREGNPEPAPRVGTRSNSTADGGRSAASAFNSTPIDDVMIAP